MSEKNDNTLDGPRLLIRTDASEYLNRQDYLLRLARSNGFRGIAELCETLGVGFAKFTTASSEGVNNFLKGGVSLFGIGSEKGLSLLMRGKGRRRRICPECISDDVPHTASFNFAIPIVCPRHNLVPHDVCEACNSPIDYLDSTVENCACGFSFSKSTRISAPAWLIDFYEKFSLGCPPEIGANQYEELAKRYVHVAHLIAYLAGSEQYIFTHKHKATAWISSIHLPAIHSFSAQWPSGAKSKLEMHRTGGLLSRRDYWLSVIRNSNIPAIHEEFSRKAVVGRRAATKTPRFPRRRVVSELPDDAVPLRASFEMLGENRYQFLLGIRKAFGREIVYKSGKYWIRKELLLPFIDGIKSTISISEAAKLSGWTVQHLRSFIRLKMLNSYRLLPSMVLVHRFKESEVRAFNEIIVRQSEKIGAAVGDLVPLNKVSPARNDDVWQPNSRTWDRFFGDVFQGKVRTFLCEEGDFSSTVYVLDEDLRKYRVPRSLIRHRLTLE